MATSGCESSVHKRDTVNGSTRNVTNDTSRTTSTAKVSYMSGWSIVPPLLLLLSPAFAMLMSYTIVELDGFTGLVAEIKGDGKRELSFFTKLY